MRFAADEPASLTDGIGPGETAGVRLCKVDRMLTISFELAAVEVDNG